jgi:pyruvate dehydrogenase E1 component alpha subunit
MSTTAPSRASTEATVSTEELHRLYRMMVQIRRFEERTEEQYTRDRIGGYCHLHIGEEATVAGTVGCLTPDDYVFGSYRDHGLTLAIGSPARDVMAELFGKETGQAHGRGGSMHLLDVERHFLGGWGIVGSQIPIAVGAAFTLDYQGLPGAVLCMFGDAAVNIGAFHEGLNLAAIWHLPVVFVITNNLYGMGTSVEMASAEPELFRRAASYRMPAERVDGQDVLAVREATQRLMRLARNERQPALLECMTYRYRGHSVADPGKSYRPADEIEAWKQRDPVLLFERTLRERGVIDDARVADIRASVEAEVQDAIDYALNSPDPDPRDLYKHVYGEAAPAEFARMSVGAPFGEASIEARPWGDPA